PTAGKKSPRFGSRDQEDADLVRPVCKGYRLIAALVDGEPIPDPTFRRRAGHEVEAMIVQSDNRHLALDPTAAVQDLSKGRAAGAARRAIGTHPVEEGFGIGAGYFELRKCREVANANTL